ncbi:helix-turn-helix transcriptional regulator [Reichenbachiella agarivorans]|uniref:Helix-turn-helix transcriptional regulator n=1 Tax=Reichenbachiella agarivorans TaxID=2979464 RepID=A0ABY6CPV9_9BACT|nr:helix-turn-helix transcriptional regulator [Reichenbachiella agarivorans]UXP32065.1 helix-turn-helix transcriptional regulator [Reichenbachiella agarivorans]
MKQVSIEIKDKTEQGQILKIAPFRKHIRKTEAHKHKNYFEIIYLSKGSGSHSIDHHSYPILGPTLFFMRRDQIHHWNIQSEPEGYVIIIKNDFVEASEDLELRQQLLALSKTSYLPVEDESIELHFRLLHLEFEKAGESQKTIFIHLLKALLEKAIELTDKHFPYTEKKSDLFQYFINLLETERPLTNQVAHYATLLHTSPQNLNQVCRKAAEQSTSALISEYIIGEAKRLLDYTSMSVAQVAYELDFKDPSHFSKYFKRQCLITPQEYRKRKRYGTRVFSNRP